MGKTVFVLGAGASAEVGLPVGDQLKGEIASLLNFYTDGWSLRNGDSITFEALMAHVKRSPDAGDITTYLEAGRHIARAMPQAESIDNFIDAHRGDSAIELCGKLAIVRAILAAERGSTFRNPDDDKSSIEHARIANTWFNVMFQRLVSNCAKADIGWRLKTVAFVIFNYDRCLEYYMFHALRNYYGISEAEAGDLVRHLEIYHPYGQVGSLPWERKSVSFRYGATPHQMDVLNLATQIKTFTETTDPDDAVLKNMQSTIADAEQIVFLGFAFHELNVKLLWPGKFVPRRTPRCFGTAFGMSPDNTQAIHSAVSNRARIDGNSIVLRSDLTSAQLMSSYSRVIRLQ